MTIISKYAQLTHLSLLRISGDDAAQFLQGQLTNDIDQLKDNWHYSGYCSPKGRLIALLHVWRSSETIYALVDSSIADSVIKRLRMYVMRSKVVIESLEGSRIIGFQGIEPLKQLAPELDTRLNQDGVTIASHKTNKAARFALRISNTALNKSQRIMLVDLAENGETPSSLNLGRLNADVCLSTKQWLAQDIDNGLAGITDKSTELFIPQMLNLDVLDGISFKKGCYTGQEIVARMHYLGKLKQRMFVCNLSTNSSPHNPGDKIFADAELTKSVGHLVTYVDDHPQALAVLRVDTIDPTSDSSTSSTKLSEQTQDTSADLKTTEGTLFLNAETSLTPLATQPYSFPANK